MAKSNKVAIVTGSATGLGASCALDLAARGWNVVINYTKSKKEADETYEAVTITYREVYENGAWGKKFQKTYRKEPNLVTPALLAKGVGK